MGGYDAIVVGAGSNGLAAACTLSKGGRKVLVLERAAVAGGLAAPDAFHPGFVNPGVFHDTTCVRKEVVRSLGLKTHGLRLRGGRPDVLALGEDGTGFLLAGSIESAAQEIARASTRDAQAYVAYRRFLRRVGGVIYAAATEHPVDLAGLDGMRRWDLLKKGLRLRGLGAATMLELFRLPPMCVADWLGEWFEGDHLKAALALPAVAGTYMGPWSPGSTANLLLWEATSGPGLVAGGSSLIAALESAARSLGVAIRTSAPVAWILPKPTGGLAVILESGEEAVAKVVLSSCDPKTTLLRLVPPRHLPAKTVRRMGNFRMRGTTAQVLLALDAPPRFPARPDHAVLFARTGARLDDLERAFDAVKYRRVSETPVLEIHVPTAADPTLAPPGRAVLSVLVHFAPYDLEQGWTDEARDRLGDRVLEILERHAPGIGSTVLARRVLSPADLEARYGLWGGHLHHGEHALDQILIRPIPECAGYKTPVPGLYLCGSGAYPGGGLTCAPGALAAAAVLDGGT
jgi:phytoene dehydrogenase-like protein